MKPKINKTNRKAAKGGSLNRCTHDNTPPAVSIQSLTPPESLNNRPVGGSTAATVAEPGLVSVDFKVFEPNAKRVALCSEFNGWSAEATPMRRCEDGYWAVTLGLKPGKYEYKFLVDGEWIPDPKAQENVSNQFGTLNSVVLIQA